jgi:hypothetical protein
MKSTLLTRLKRLEAVRAVERSHLQLKIEFTYLKLLPREYSGPRHTGQNRSSISATGVECLLYFCIHLA